MNRRKFLRNAAGLLVPAMLAPVARAGLITQSRPLWVTSSGNVTYYNGWSGPSTIADGDTPMLTKAAGGLGLRTDERPLLWIPGETDFLRDATYSRTVVTMTARSGCTVDTAVKPANAAGSLRQSWPIGVAGSDDHCFFSNNPVWTWGDSGSTVTPSYVSLKRRYNWDNEAAYNDKCIRYWGTTVGNTPDVYVLPGSSIDNDASRIIVEGWSDYHDSNDVLAPYYGANMEPDTWYQDEHLFRDSSLNTYDGIVRHYRNAARAHPESVNWQSRGTGEPGTAIKWKGFLDQYSNPTSTGMESGTKYLYMCHLYITDTFFRIVASPETSWTQLTMNGVNDPGFDVACREVQLPTQDSGSDTGCRVKARKGSYASMSGLNYWFYPPSGAAPELILNIA